MRRYAFGLFVIAAAWMAGDHPTSAQQNPSDPCPLRYRRGIPEVEQAREAKKARLRSLGMPERFLHLLDKEECVACIEKASDAFHIQVEYNDDANAPTTTDGRRITMHAFRWDPQSERQVREQLAAGKIRKFYIYNTARRCDCCPEIGMDGVTPETHADWDSEDEVNKDQVIEYDEASDLGPMPEDIENPPSHWYNDVPNIQQFSKPGRRVLQAPCPACQGIADQWNRHESNRNFLWDKKIAYQERISVIENAIGNRNNEIVTQEFHQLFPSTAAAATRQIENLQKINEAQQSDADKAGRDLAEVDAQIAEIDAAMAALMTQILECEKRCKTALAQAAQPAEPQTTGGTPSADVPPTTGTPANTTSAVKTTPTVGTTTTTGTTTTGTTATTPATAGAPPVAAAPTQAPTFEPSTPAPATPAAGGSQVMTLNQLRNSTEPSDQAYINSTVSFFGNAPTSGGGPSIIRRTNPDGSVSYAVGPSSPSHTVERDANGGLVVRSPDGQLLPGSTPAATGTTANATPVTNTRGTTNTTATTNTASTKPASDERPNTIEDSLVSGNLGTLRDSGGGSCFGGDCADEWKSCADTGSCRPIGNDCGIPGACSGLPGNFGGVPYLDLTSPSAWSTSTRFEIEIVIQVKQTDVIDPANFPSLALMPPSLSPGLMPALNLSTPGPSLVIPPHTQQDVRQWFNPLGLLARNLVGMVERWRGSIGPRPLINPRDLKLVDSYTGGQAAGLPAGVHVLLTDLGGSTGKTLAMQILNLSGRPVRLSSMPFSVEPLKQEAQQRIQQAFSRLSKAAPVGLDLAAYCVELFKAPPRPNTILRLAPPAVQQKFAPMTKVLQSAYRVQKAGLLRPDSNPAAYTDAIKQWAVWVVEQKFNETRFTEAFAAHTKKNVEAAGQQWSKPAEDMIRKVSPNRWQDIVKVLKGAGLPVPQ